METFLRVQAHAPEVPVLVLTGLDDEAAGLRAVRRGAQDYLVKANVTGEVLASALRYAVQRKRLEETVKRRELFVERIVNTVPEILYVYDLVKGCIIYVNGRIYKILGYSPKKIEKMGPDVIGMLIHPDYREKAQDHLKKLAKAEDDEVVDCEYQIKHADGSWRWLRSRDVVFERDAEGVPIKSLGSAQEIANRQGDEVR
jgi:PAS domain S-box-containing protein